MKSKRLYCLVLLALLSSCSVNNQATVPSNMPNNSSSSNPNNNSTTPTANPNNITPTPSNPITNISNGEFKSFTLSSEQIKQLSESSIVTANNTLGLKIFSEIRKEKEQQDKNVFISPSSIALALQMTYNGADKETKDEMTKALQLNNLSIDDVNSLSNLLINKLNDPAPDITLKVANSLWGGLGKIKFNQNFKNTLKTFYNSESKELDFSDPKTLELINKWASDNTNEKIPKILNKIDSNATAYLMNAIYFKADWTEKFKETDTQNREFTLSDGSKKQHPMMSSFRDYRYFSNYNRYSNNDMKSEDRFEAAELTYGKDEKVSLYIFLPDKDSSLEKFYSQLNNENLEKWIKGFYNNSGYVSFPKFKTKWEKEVQDNLVPLGMKSAFSPSSANFSKMGSSPLGNIYISFVKHSTFIDVNEEGSEAAAVTIVGTGAGSSAPTPRFVADRPFFYIIRDNETKSILFMGEVKNPEYEK